MAKENASITVPIKIQDANVVAHTTHMFIKGLFLIVLHKTKTHHMNMQHTLPCMQQLLNEAGPSAFLSFPSPFLPLHASLPSASSMSANCRHPDESFRLLSLISAVQPSKYLPDCTNHKYLLDCQTFTTPTICCMANCTQTYPRLVV